MSYLFSGHSGIYSAQRIGTVKFEESAAAPNISVGDARRARRKRKRSKSQDADDERDSP
jgi:hypothetical protein